MVSRVYSWRVILLSYLLTSNITICWPAITPSNYISVEGVNALILIVVGQPSRNYNLVSHSIYMVRRACSWRVILLSHLLANNITICWPAMTPSNYMSVEEINALILIVIGQPSRNYNLASYSIYMISRACFWRVTLLSHLLASNITIYKPIINLYRCRRVNALIIVVIMKRKVLIGIKSREVKSW